MSQKKITNRLKSLEEINDVSVEVSGPKEDTIRISHAKQYAPQFLFRWHTDYFIGYFIDVKGNQSQAVLSLYTPMSAIQFVSAFVMLNQIQAYQKAT